MGEGDYDVKIAALRQRNLELGEGLVALESIFTAVCTLVTLGLLPNNEATFKEIFARQEMIKVEVFEIGAKIEALDRFLKMPTIGEKQ